MIYLIGVGQDSTITHFHDRTKETTFVDIRDCFSGKWNFYYPCRDNACFVYMDGARVNLDPNGSYYVRLIDISRSLSKNDRILFRTFLGALSSFLSIIPGKVINRPGGHNHNGSKPFHEQWLIGQGFDVPESLTTSSVKEIRKFMGTYPDCIVKTICGVRATARRVSLADFNGFHKAQGPVHLQRRIEGYDLRVHLVDGSYVCEQIDCEFDDYREHMHHSHHHRISIPDGVLGRMIVSSSLMGLTFSGWDFKVDQTGRFWCLESNPMPGYNSYDNWSSGDITQLLVNYLTTIK